MCLALEFLVYRRNLIFFSFLMIFPLSLSPFFLLSRLPSPLPPSLHPFFIFFLPFIFLSSSLPSSFPSLLLPCLLSFPSRPSSPFTPSLPPSSPSLPSSLCECTETGFARHHQARGIRHTSLCTGRRQTPTSQGDRTDQRNEIRRIVEEINEVRR